MKAAVVDTEKDRAEHIVHLLEKYRNLRGVELEISVFHNPVDFVTDYNTPLDLIIMAAEMPIMDGFECAAKLRSIDPLLMIIFISSGTRHVLEAFDVEAVGYFVHPVSEAALFAKLDRIKRYSNYRGKKILISTENGIRILHADEIYYVEGSNQYIIYHTAVGNFRVRRTMKSAEQTLGEGFARPTSSFLVNLNYVSRISRGEVLVGDTGITISRPKKKAFLERCRTYFGTGFESREVT